MRASGQSLAAALATDGFVFVAADDMRAALEDCGPLGDWAAFTRSWDDLGVDEFMADGGRYRRRRFARFTIDGDGAIERLAHGPHFQTRDYNPLNGGIARWFEPITDAVADSVGLHSVLSCAHRLFQGVAAAVAQWYVEVHQFRIEARADQPGQPTPEGLHRDGVDFVLVLLLSRHNIASGTTSIHALDGRDLGSFTLTRPLDAAIVNDARVFHGVTAVEPIDASEPAHRDVLVVTFRAARGTSGGCSD